MSRNQREGYYRGKLQGKYYRSHSECVGWAIGPRWFNAELTRSMQAMKKEKRGQQ